MKKRTKKPVKVNRRALLPAEYGFIMTVKMTPAHVRNAPMSIEERERQTVALVAGLEDLQTGRTRLDDAYSLQKQINETMKICEAGHLGTDVYLQDVVAAREALLQIALRSHKTNVMKATDEEHQAIATFVDLRVELLKHPEFTLRMSQDARIEVINCFRRGHFDAGPAVCSSKVGVIHA